MTTRSAQIRLAALLALATPSCLNWSRFHGPTADVPSADTACVNTSAPDYCASIPALASPPTLDGTLECGVPLQRFTAADYYALNGPLPASVVANFAVAWRPEGLYVYGQFEGANDDPARGTEGAYCGDSLEIFVDDDGVNHNLPMYDSAGTRQFVIAAPERTAASSSLAGIYRDRQLVSAWDHAQWVSVRSGSQVRFEALIIARDLGVTSWTLAAAQHIGFDLAVTLGTGTVTDAGSCGHILGRFSLRLAPGDAGCFQPSCNPLAFCTPTLAP